MELLDLQETEETLDKGDLKEPKARQEILVRLGSMVIQEHQEEITPRGDQKGIQAMLAQREKQGWMEIKEIPVNQAGGALMVEGGLLGNLVLLENLVLMV